MKLNQIVTGKWMKTDNEAFREYVFPNGAIYRIDRPKKVIIKRKDDGDSHRVVSEGDDGKPVSHYVPAGWMAIRWKGVDGSEAFGW